MDEAFQAPELENPGGPTSGSWPVHFPVHPEKRCLLWADELHKDIPCFPTQLGALCSAQPAQLCVAAG